MAGTVLLVEDEPSVGELVRGYLSRDGYRVIWVRSGEDALVELDRHPVRLVLLDIGLPGKDGFDVCREIRARSHVPILMLTARDEEPDRIVGLEVGADDYITKPFSPRELVARMKAVLRRSEPQTGATSSTLGDVVLDRESHDVTVAGQARRADREGVRPARVLPREHRHAPLARPAARSRLGSRVPRRHADRRRSRRAAAAQARAPGSDPHAARRRATRPSRREQPAGAAVRGDARRARPDPRADDRHRRGADAPAGRPHAGDRARAARRRPRAAAARAAPSYINQNRLSGSVRIIVAAAVAARAVRGERQQGRATARRPTRASSYLYSYRTIPSRGLLLLRPASVRSAEWKPFLRDLLFAALAGAALAAVLSFLIARSIARPIRRVADATRAFAADERHEPLPEVGTREVASLAQAFNEMAEQLVGLARGRAQLPALGQPRAEDAADRDPRLRRRPRRRRVRARRGGAR